MARRLRTLLVAIVACGILAPAAYVPLFPDAHVHAQTSSTNPYAFPRAAGIKLRGVNIAPRASDLISGFNPWYKLTFDHATADASDPWTRWLKPNLDAAADDLHCNFVRFMYEPFLRIAFPGYTTITAGQYETVLAQFINYAASKGLWVYLAPSTSSGLDAVISNGTTLSEANAYFTEYIAFTSQFPNVIGYDISQEFSLAGDSWIRNNLPALFTNAKAARVLGQPVTATVLGFTSLADDGSRWQNVFHNIIIAAGAEFADAHLYPPGGGISAGDIGYLTYNGDNIPVIIGEVGKLATDTAGDIVTFYDMIKGFSEDPLVQATTVWSLSDFGPGAEWGVFSDAQNGSYALTTPRATQSAAVQLMRKTPKYYASRDGFAVIESVPTVTARTATTISLSWPAAVGGNTSRARTYTAQCSVVTAFGFPTSTTWTSATPTTGLEATVTGLDASRYACRVKTSSDVAP